MKKLSQRQVIARLRERQGGRTLTVFGKEIGVGASFLSDIYAGKRGFGRKILAYLGLVEDPPTYSETAPPAPKKNDDEDEEDDAEEFEFEVARDPWK